MDFRAGPQRPKTCIWVGPIFIQYGQGEAAPPTGWWAQSEGGGQRLASWRQSMGHKIEFFTAGRVLFPTHRSFWTEQGPRPPD